MEVYGVYMCNLYKFANYQLEESASMFRLLYTNIYIYVCVIKDTNTLAHNLW